ncbi:transposase [Streptomyces sp. NPDC005146]
MTFFFALEEEIAKATAELSTVLPDTPACVLTSLPGVGIVTASAYGAAIGDQECCRRLPCPGLVPIAYGSAGKSRRGNRISREGSVELRRAIVDLRRGMGFHHADFVAYRRSLLSEGKPPLVATIAVGHRAHRLAFL